MQKSRTTLTTCRKKNLITQITLAWLFLAISLPTFFAGAITHYVDANGTNAISPYTNWITAATNIQDAIDAAVAKDEIVVTNGVYRSGGPLNAPSRVSVTKPMKVRSVNGPRVTQIEGNSSKRCVYLTNGASLIGFTLTKGSTTGSGGGLYCESTNATASDCIIMFNSALYDGAGVYNGTLSNCIILANSGTATSGCTLWNCVITRNAGVGAKWGVLNNCVVSFNNRGSGVANSSCRSCTIVGNSGGEAGAWYSSLRNCIVFYNTGTYSPNIYGPSYEVYHCFTEPMQAGNVNFTNEPAFVDWINSDFRLASNSPCINSGNDSYAAGTFDVEGNPRIKGGAIDVGAYEFQSPGSSISSQWLQTFGLATDGSMDLVDSDGDTMSNWAEWRAKTIPTNAASVLRLQTPVFQNGTVTLSWSRSSGVWYYLQRSTNLSAHPTFVTIGMNLIDYYQDVPPPNVPVFYRVGVQ